MSMSELLPNMSKFSRGFGALRQRVLPEDDTPARPRLVERHSKVPPLRPRVDIPVREPAPEQEAREKYRNRGRFLARQEAWEELGQEICSTDSERLMTPGLTPVAQLLAEGARADVVGAARGAVGRGEPGAARTVLGALELNFEENPNCPALAYVVARAHIDVAKAWRGASQLRELAPMRRDAYDRHMRAATEFVDQFDPFEFDSALWAGVRCSVLETDARPAQRVTDDYEDLVELAPNDPAGLIALGRDLLPSRFGTWEVLDTHARRIANLCGDVWGAGGYSWVYMGALEQDPRAVRRLDVELFVEGLHEIVERHPDQHMVNRLAAFAGLSLVRTDFPGEQMQRLSDCFGWIVQDHLTELHPAVWAEAPVPGTSLPAELEEADLLKRGKARAVTTLAQYYAAPLEAGRRLVFTADGLQILKGD